MPKIPTLSLFSGAGGLDIGFAQAGFDILACVEIEPSYARTLEANANGKHAFSATTRVHCQDIREFDPTPYENSGIRCIIGGPPCQTFSAAGRRSGGVIGVDDQRGQLFRAYCEILRRIRPEVFIFENVYGLPGANGGEPWREIIKAFSEVGYKLKAEVVDAADYGVPQHRERLIMVGFKCGEFEFPLPTHGPDSAAGRRLVSVEDAILDLQDDKEPFHGGLGGLYGHLLPEVPEGLNYAYFTSEMGHPEPTFAWRSKFHDLLYKVNRREPCRTIKAQPGKFTEPFHWKNRHFTAAELKRLQTFPGEYEIIGSYGKVVEQIGNSVPPKLAYVIAASVRDQLILKVPLEFVQRPSGFSSTFRQRQRQRSAKFKEIARIANSSRDPSSKGPSRISGLSEEFFINPVTLFDRRRHKQSTKTNTDLSCYDVKIIEDRQHIEIQFVKNGVKSGTKLSTISIDGFNKYLPDYCSCTVLAEVDSIGDIFHAWNIVEDVLTMRSNFFSLIDIYGHYANKGDAVNIETDWRFTNNRPLVELLNRFGSTARCGDFVDKKELLRQLDISGEKLSVLIAEMRLFRFDIRTDDTHPIIGSDRILCTYPFPLLSPRALVESRVLLNRKSLNAKDSIKISV